MTLTKEKRALWRVHALAKGSFNRFEVLSLLDELDAVESDLAKSRLSASMACESPDPKCECAGCSTAAALYLKGSTP
jgi:hypothetical protein